MSPAVTAGVEHAAVMADTEGVENDLLVADASRAISPSLREAAALADGADGVEPGLAPQAHPVAADAPRVHGQLLEKLPDDLYIPPDALRVFLTAFEGPLDLLLYLIRKQNLDILDIPVHTITQQYVRYIELMTTLRLELAAEYLLMAALLAEIKSRILLPRPVAVTDEVVDDPRMELVRRLQEYERFKTAAESLDALPRVGRDFQLAHARPDPDAVRHAAPVPPPALRTLLHALRDVLMRAALSTSHQVRGEPLSVRARMSAVLARLRAGPCELPDLVTPGEGRAGLVVALLAVLELAKSFLVVVVQESPFDPVRLALPASTGASLGGGETDAAVADASFE